MSGRLPDDLPPELLAGYADGELCPDLRARVQEWLARHPEFLDRLESQELLGPGNAELWNAVRPPAPGAGDWAGVRKEVAGRLRRRGGWRCWAGAAGLVAAAAALVVVFLDNPPPCAVRNCLPPAAPGPAPATDDDEPYPVARADEVRYLSLPESAAPMLVVGEHPLKELVLARDDEVEFHGLGSDAAGQFPEDPLTADPPVLWTPAPRDP